MPRKPIHAQAMTSTQRAVRWRNAQAEEIRLLRMALLDAIADLDTIEPGTTRFRTVYADVIERAKQAIRSAS